MKAIDIIKQELHDLERLKDQLTNRIAYGRNYNFGTTSEEQLASILDRIGLCHHLIFKIEQSLGE